MAIRILNNSISCKTPCPGPLSSHLPPNPSNHWSVLHCYSFAFSRVSYACSLIGHNLLRLASVIWYTAFEIYPSCCMHTSSPFLGLSSIPLSVAPVCLSLNLLKDIRVVLSFGGLEHSSCKHSFIVFWVKLYFSKANIQDWGGWIMWYLCISLFLESAELFSEVAV